MLEDKCQVQSDLLVSLVQWNDEILELKSVINFLGDAVYLIISESEGLEAGTKAHGLHLVFREINRRIEELQSDMSEECLSLRQAGVE